MRPTFKFWIAVLFLLPSWSLTFAADFVIEPINTKFSILGYAQGQFLDKNDNGCFKIESVKLVLNESAKQGYDILGIRFAASVPYEIDSFDFLSQTKVYPINTSLKKGVPIALRNIELCLEDPVQSKVNDFFLSMEILLKHSNPPGYATTYAHEKSRYEKLMSRPVVLVEKFSLSADSGKFKKKTLAQALPKSSISASLKLTEFNRSDAWPPAAYIGFYQGAIRDSSFQFLIIRNRACDKYLVAGYRIINDDREVSVESIENLPLGTTVNVSLQFENGTVKLKVNNNDPIKINTSLTEASPYVSVSSGVAEFNVGP